MVGKGAESGRENCYCYGLTMLPPKGSCMEGLILIAAVLRAEAWEGCKATGAMTS